jgi:heme/copper-type cytochrome/quinol oxidase subunit 2
MRPSFADGLFWTSVACCAIAQLFIIRSVLGSRHVPAPEPATRLPQQRGAVELLWVVVPAIALAVLLHFTWRAVRATQDPMTHPSGHPAAEATR